MTLGAADAESPIGRYAATLALLTLGRWQEALPVASTLRGLDDFPPDVAEALVGVASADSAGFAAAVVAVIASFESREAYLEDVAVADTAIVLQALAGRRGVAAELPASAVLPRRRA